MNMDEKIESMLSQIGERLDFIYNSNNNYYAGNVKSQWKKPNWTVFILETYRFGKSEEWFLDILFFNFIKVKRFISNPLSVIYRVSGNVNLSEQFLKKYRNILNWEVIARELKPSFRLLWLMRHNLDNFEVITRYNMRLSKKYKNRFIKMLNQERERKNGL